MIARSAVRAASSVVAANRSSSSASRASCGPAGRVALRGEALQPGPQRRRALARSAPAGPATRSSPAPPRRSGARSPRPPRCRTASASSAVSRAPNSSRTRASSVSRVSSSVEPAARSPASASVACAVSTSVSTSSRARSRSRRRPLTVTVTPGRRGDRLGQHRHRVQAPVERVELRDRGRPRRLGGREHVGDRVERLPHPGEQLGDRDPLGHLRRPGQPAVARSGSPRSPARRPGRGRMLGQLGELLVARPRPARTDLPRAGDQVAVASRTAPTASPSPRSPRPTAARSARSSAASRSSWWPGWASMATSDSAIRSLSPVDLLQGAVDLLPAQHGPVHRALSPGTAPAAARASVPSRLGQPLVVDAPSRCRRRASARAPRSRTARSRSGPSGIAMPYGSAVNRSPTTSVNGSCAARPARIVSSVDTASTWFCCSITRQSVQPGTSTPIGLDVRVDDVGQRRGLLGGAHLLAAERVDAGEAGVLLHQHPLAGLVVDRGELDVLAPLAVDRHGLHDEVDVAVLQRGDALRRGEDAQLDRVAVAEDGPGDLARHVEVEALDLTGDRVAEAELVGVLVDADDQLALLRGCSPSSSRPAVRSGPGRAPCGRRLAVGSPQLVSACSPPGRLVTSLAPAGRAGRRPASRARRPRRWWSRSPRRPAGRRRAARRPRGGWSVRGVAGVVLIGTP